jgi:hypothetical protein
MTDAGHSTEERILRAVKRTLTNVIKDTATPHGMRHPLSDGTIEDLRRCLALISARERELAEAAGRPTDERPRYADEPARGDNVVRLDRKPADGE